MASILEQYEQSAALCAGYMSMKPSIPEMTTAGLVSAKLEDEVPIFSKVKINYSPADNITHVVVCDNHLTLGMKNKITRIDMKNHSDSHDINLLKAVSLDSRIYGMYLDITGRHLLLSLVAGDDHEPLDNIYLFWNSKKPQQAAKMKGHVISAVAWNYQNTSDTSTGCILVGTTKGHIYETELAYFEERSIFQAAPDQYWKQVYDISANSENSNVMVNITSIFYHKISSDTYTVFVTTPSRLFQFNKKSTASEPPYLQSIFSSYTDLPEGFIELPGSLPYSELQLSYSSPKVLPHAMAWMTEPGVLTGNLVFKDIVAPDYCILNRKLLSYQDEKSERKVPLSIVVTQFHVLVLFRDRVKVFFVLDEELIYEDIYTELYGPLMGIIRDPMTGTIWVYSEQAIYRYEVNREDRNVWHAYLQMKNFEEAKKYCRNDPIKLDKVLLEEAEEYFQKKEYEKSAKLYAQTYSSFEMIALKFLEFEEEGALKTFLLKKLEGLKQSDQTQITMTVLWLLEIYLNQLGMLRNSGRQNLESYHLLRTEFQNLLKEKHIQQCISNNRSAVYKLMTNHGDEENLIYFTGLMKDYEREIQYHLQQKDYFSALDVLTKQGRVELFYKFSPVLMQTIPQKTVSAWIEQGNRLDPVKLIPALVQYDHPKDNRETNEAIRYLEHCIKMGSPDPAIHNYLLALNARLQPDKLMTYLEIQGQDPDIIPYDLKFALRLCSDLGLNRACVHIYTAMGLYEEAVDLALKFDIDLAKRNADRPEDDEELKKKLWLKIAKHVVEEENDIKRAMKFLQECELIKIEDILPFFPDFVTIDHFKDAICSSLQEYNQHIQGLKEEMEEATESAQEIRSEIQTFRNRFNVVKAQQKCSSCNYPIMTRSFYLFPCHHMFHSDCLIEEIRPHLPPGKRSRIEDIQRQLGIGGFRDDTASISSSSLPSAVISSKDKLCAELDDLVASECILCGDLMIRSIDVPFVPMEQYSEILRSWE